MSAVLTLLRIRNLALVEELEWQIEPGFVAVTGETGAGKSIIIGALQLLLGERADKSLIRTGADLCTVEAVFSGADLQKLNPQLAEAGIEPCEDDLILKRTLSSTGTNRQFINGSPTTLSVLKDLGDELVDLHGPHDHQSLLSPETQLRLLDSFARAEQQLEEYRNALSAIADIARRTCCAEHGGNGARTGAGFASAPNHRDQIGKPRRGRRRRNREALQTRQQQQTVNRACQRGREQTFRGRRFRSRRSSRKLNGCFENWKRSTARSHNSRRRTPLLWSSFPK